MPDVGRFVDGLIFDRDPVVIAVPELRQVARGRLVNDFYGKVASSVDIEGQERAAVVMVVLYSRANLSQDVRNLLLYRMIDQINAGRKSRNEKAMSVDDFAMQLRVCCQHPRSMTYGKDTSGKGRSFKIVKRDLGLLIAAYPQMKDVLAGQKEVVRE